MAGQETTFGGALKAWRKSRDLTQAEAALQFRCSQSWYSKLENDATLPSQSFRERFEMLRQERTGPITAQRAGSSWRQLLDELATYGETDPDDVAFVLRVAIQLFKLGRR